MDIINTQTNKTDLMGLHDLLMPGTIEPGFYVASGPRELVSVVMDKLVNFLHSESETKSSQISKTKALSESVLRPFELVRTPEWSIQSQIGQLYWVDSGNSFDPYRMALTSVRRGLNPNRILRALQVARPFTAFQFQQMLDKVPAPTLFKMREGGSKVTLVARRPLVILSDLLKLFYDEEIQEKDVKRAFRNFLVRLAALKKRAIVLGIHSSYPAPAGRGHFLSQILGLATRVRSFSNLRVYTEKRVAPPVLVQRSA